MKNYLSSLNVDYIESLAEQYRSNPERLDPTWRYFFDGVAVSSIHTPGKKGLPAENLEFEVKVLKLILGYREMGFLIADVNPLQRGLKTHPLLALENYGLEEKDLDKVCKIGQVLGFGAVSLRKILDSLIATYCAPAAIEFDHIEDPITRQWIQEKIENRTLMQPLSEAERARLVQKLCEAQGFEEFLHKRFVGKKRFSVEGLEAIIPMLDFLIDEAARHGADEIIIGMAHRGRLNVLANIFKKDLKLMMAEFSGNLDAEAGDGDVKYHMGFSQNVQTSDGKNVHLSLLPNPSHLEAINPVLMGVARAKQKIKNDTDCTRTLAVLLHGEASFSGQGVIYETLNMSELEGYRIGGVVHIITNNQVGFTATPKESHSTPQATDIAKMLEIPIFRVNADEFEAAIRTMALAVECRYLFKRDVVIDLMGYRRYGHNEADEPTFTQPLLYKVISDHPRPMQVYQQKLKNANSPLDEAHFAKAAEAVHQRLDEALNEIKKNRVSPMMHSFGDRWKNLVKPTDKNIFMPVHSGIPVNRLKEIGAQLLTFPAHLHPHPKLKRNLEDRKGMLDGRRPLDWGMAESLAFGSLLMDGYPIRLAGQDSERGTFSHRHAIFHDVQTGDKYCPLNHLKGLRVDFEVVNSLLSEYAALGFELGQSWSNPHKLTIWEAQYGDFANGAQIIIDQFLTSSAFKWQRYSGLVVLLPHGYEGQGPEHSSARLERFLQLCAQNNIQVCNLTQPAQYFHLLRRQMLRDIRLPLVVMAPKSLLRHPSVVSPLEDFQNTFFQEVLDDPNVANKDAVKRVVFCSGKIYYELAEMKKKENKADVALVRIEQFYPFPRDMLLRVLAGYPAATEIVWCQEGPQNAEGWSFILQMFPPLLRGGQSLTYVGRSAQASPADSYMHLYLKEQERIAKTALGVTV